MDNTQVLGTTADVAQNFYDRCKALNLPVSVVCNAAGVQMSVLATWKTRGGSDAYIQFVRAMEKHVPFEVIYNELEAIGDLPERNQAIGTYVRMERELRRRESNQ